MAREWTARQREAIELRGSSALVSAGAGSGKTAVMTERIVHLILEGASVRDMLVVTFTDAAASEMRTRIQRRLKQASLDESLSKSQRAHAADEYSIFYEANISTLHSFCSSVIRRHFQLCGMDPALRVLDSYRSEILKAAAADTVLESRYDAADADFLALDDNYGDRREGLAPLLFRVSTLLDSCAEPEKWLKDSVEFYALDEQGFLDAESSRRALTDAVKLLENALELLRYARACVPKCPELEKFCALADDELLRLNAVLTAAVIGGRKAFDAVNSLDGFNFVSLAKLPRKLPDDVECALDREQLKEYRSAAKDLISDIHAESFCVEKQLMINARLYPQLCALYSAVMDYRAEYARLKKNAGAIDYSDMERGAMAALENDATAEEYRQKFRYIFIDEYQDTNPVQERLISLIRRGDSLFCVGDVKQSIYRFRGADPSIFTACMKRFQSNKGGVCIPLNTNFRSSHNILDAVNDVFYASMSLGGELDYTADDALDCGNASKNEINPPVCVSLLERVPGRDASEIEALHIAKLIRDVLGKPLSGGRKVGYGDIAVLLRSPRGRAEKFARVLACDGIPAFVQLSGGFFQAIEVQNLLDILKLIDNPRQDVALLGVMRSGLFGFADADIAELRLAYPDKTLYGAFAEACRSFAAASGGLPRFFELCAALGAFLADARALSRCMRLEALLCWVLEKTRFRELTRVLPGGAGRLSNVEGFVKLARDYENASSRNLSGFLKNIADALKSNQDLGEKGSISAGADCVRLMSIHRSKGMEYPVVIIAQSGRGFNVSDASARIITSFELGLCAKLLDRKTQELAPTLCWHTAARAIRERSTSADELRMLYVAMTRAEEYLYITGTVLKEKKAPSCYLDFVTRAFEQNDDGEFDTKNCSADWRIERVSAESEEISSAGGLSRDAFYSVVADIRKKSPPMSRPPLNVRLAGVVGKLSASELDRDAALESEIAPVPKFLENSSMSAAGAGSAAHIALRHLDLADAKTPEQVTSQLDNMLSRQMLTPAQRKAVNVSQLCSFANGRLGQRITASARVERELPFSLLITPAELLRMARLSSLSGVDEKSPDRLAVQGIIDLCFEENGSWVLLDYKTDRVKSDPNAAALRHEHQLALYAAALEKLTGMSVSERYIYFLRTGDAVRL